MIFFSSDSNINFEVAKLYYEQIKNHMIFRDGKIYKELDGKRECMEKNDVLIDIEKFIKNLISDEIDKNPKYCFEDYEIAVEKYTDKNFVLEIFILCSSLIQNFKKYKHLKLEYT